MNSIGQFFTLLDDLIRKVLASHRNNTNFLHSLYLVELSYLRFASPHHFLEEFYGLGRKVNVLELFHVV